MKKFVPFLITLVLVASCTQPVSNETPDILSESEPEKAGMSEERLLLIDAMLTEAITQNQVPGALALVARHGKIVYYKAFGMADTEAGRSLQRDDIFRIASQTKAITSTAVMMLWEEGKFSLDDPISRYIPEFENALIFESLNEADSTFTGPPGPCPDQNVRRMESLPG